MSLQTSCGALISTLLTDSVTHLSAWLMYYFLDKDFAGTHHVQSQIVSGPN